MRVLVVGAYGLIGSHVLSHLHARGHEVVGAGRDLTAARRFPYAAWLRVDIARMQKVEDWREPLGGIEAVVNCAGALQDSLRDDLRAVHVDGTLALYRACGIAGVRRIVHVSAAGVGPGRGTAFNDTKLEAEAAMSSLETDWVILRPGLVLAQAAYGGTALLRGLAAVPFVIPAVHAGSLVQVVSVWDVAEAAARALEPTAPTRVTVDLVGPAAMRLADVLKGLRRWLGCREAPVLDLPPVAAAIAARISDALAALGWRSPMRTTSVAQLRMGVTGDPEPAARLFGLRPAGLGEILAGWPSGVQERWFARLYFLKPLGLAGLALFWFASGAIGLARIPAAAAVLTEAGWSVRAAQWAVVIGAGVDLALACGVCVRRTAPFALVGMALVSLGYLAAGTLARPDLWGDPLGPFLKVLPGMLLALMLAAIMDER